jgi:hypothetical protein
MGRSIQYTSGFMMAMAILIVGCILTFLLVWAMFELWNARRIVKRLDHSNYYLCDVHGAIREQDMLVIEYYEDGQECPPMCPLCSKEKSDALIKRLEREVNTLQRNR